MKLQDLLESDLNISITITIKELKEFADYLLQQSKDDIERLSIEHSDIGVLYRKFFEYTLLPMKPQNYCMSTVAHYISGIKMDIYV